jgi:hypothetical protein
MTIQENGTTSSSGSSSSSPQSENITESYNTIYASSTTYKVNVSLAAQGENVTYTAWILKNGTVLAINVEGYNLTGSEAQENVFEVFAGFTEQIQADSEISQYTAPNDFHSTGTSTVSVGPTEITVTTYAANTLPETLGSCGSTTTLTAYSISVGTPQGTTSPLIIYEHIAGSETVNGTTTFLDLTLQITSITLASASTTSTSTSSSTPSIWLSGPSYPLQAGGGSGVIGQSCVNGTATIYCIGGIGYNDTVVSNVYSATVSTSGLSGWTADTPYPQAIGSQSCVSYQGYVYCVGGEYNYAGDDVASSYFAQLTSTGVGMWEPTTSYPVPIDSLTCAPSSGYIFCEGGENETDGTNATLVQSNSAWYAQLTASGIGTWKQTTAYPQGVFFPTCTATSTEIYCVGGFDSSYNGLDNVYYAPLSSSGIGQWSSTTPYPIQMEGAYCAIASGSMICVGGTLNFNYYASAYDNVYSATILASGVGPWHQTASYPIDIDTDCTMVSGNLYCIGGSSSFSSLSDIWTDFTYYVSVQSLLE